MFLLIFKVIFNTVKEIKELHSLTVFENIPLEYIYYHIINFKKIYIIVKTVLESPYFEISNTSDILITIRLSKKHGKRLFNLSKFLNNNLGLK